MIQQKVIIEWMVRAMMTSRTKEEFRESADKIMKYINEVSGEDIFLKISLCDFYEKELMKYESVKEQNNV